MSARPRWGLALVTLVESACFGAAGALVPWDAAAPRALCFAFAAMHGLTGALALSSFVGPGRVAWRLLAWGSLAALAAATWALVTSAAYITSLYRFLGAGVALTAAAAWCVVALFTLPIGAWGLVATSGPRPRQWKRLVAWLVGASWLLALTSAVVQARSARATERPVDPVATEEMLRTALRAAPPPVDPSLVDARAADCSSSPASAVYTLLVVHRAPRAVCLQGPSLAAIATQLGELLRSGAVAPPMTVDLVTATQPLTRRLAWLDPFKLRPGLDGACAPPRCVAPWQLVARDRFMSLALPFDPDERLGVAARDLGTDLNTLGDGLDGLVRIETKAWLVTTDRALVALERGRAVGARDTTSVSVAHLRARDHMLAAQESDGRFRYLLEPFAAAGEAPLQVARQAGATLALCEEGGSGDRVREAARRALRFLAEREQPVGEGLALVAAPRKRASLPDLALPLAAILTCRELVGSEFDALAGRLLALLLRAQKPGGDFAGTFDPSGPKLDTKVLYGDGQAVLALVLAERALASAGAKPAAPFPSREVIHAAAQRAMDHFAGPYWSHPLRGVTFLEENWHCLAARAALEVHRHDGYERFCLEYVKFKARFIDEGADPFPGGFAVAGALTLPHVTPTAGFGETLAAAVAVKRARGDSVERDLAVLRRVLAFLVAAQWDPVSVEITRHPADTLGGFSRHLASPVVRIDYVQHAWSALGHGGRALGLAETR